MQWLPALVEINAYGGNWEAYLAAIFAVFEKDFIHTRPRGVIGKRFALKRQPEYQRKPCTFWHIISDGAKEEALPTWRAAPALDGLGQLLTQSNPAM